MSFRSKAEDQKLKILLADSGKHTDAARAGDKRRAAGNGQNQKSESVQITEPVDAKESSAEHQA